MGLRLISTLGCPFVQRAVILLSEKGVPYETAAVDLKQKPDWFFAISPYGRVPVLVVDGTPIFESSAICEFLEETHPEPPLFPRDPLARARDRAWFAASAADLYGPMMTLLTNPGQAEAAGRALDERMARFDRELEGRDWLSGDGSRFGMADVAAASFLSRTGALERIGRWSFPQGLERARAWRDRVCARESVARSVPPDLDELLRRLVARPSA